MRTLKVKSISVMLIFSMMLAMFMPLISVNVYAESDTRTQITKINLNVVSGTAVAKYGEKVAQPNLEIVSTEPASAKDYLSVSGALWYQGSSWVTSSTFGEGKYYLLVTINLSDTSKYKFDSPTNIMYINGTQLHSSAVGTNYIRNELRYTLESPDGTAPTITTTSLLEYANKGDAYSATLTATGSKPITWSLKSGSSLPSGLSLSSTGVISGTPTVSGDYDFTVVATNSAGSVEKNLSLKIKNLQQITRINLHATSGTTVAKYGEKVAQPNLEIVSTEPASAKDYLSVGALWYQGGSWVTSSTFGEGEYYLHVSINLSDTSKYKFDSPTDIMYIDGTQLNSNAVGTNYIRNDLRCNVTSTATTHEVTFNSNGGSAVAQQNVVHGETATEPSEPTRFGHSFAGWYSDSTLLTPFDFSTPIKNNTRLYAKWNVAHNVTFNLDGGTWTDTGTNPQVVNHGETAIRPTNPTKSGHVFAGWYADSACTTPFSFLTAITSNKTIYAKWNIITNSVNAILSPTPSVGLTIGDLVLTSGDSSKYSVSAGYWKLNDSGSALDKSSTQFEAGQIYTLYLTYYPENGYNIPDDATYTVNGIPTEWSGFEAKTNRKINFTIPAPATQISELSATVTAPVGGEHPSFTVTVPDGAHYTAVVYAWYDLNNNGAHLTNSDTFVTGNEYQVRIHFTANTGYEIATSASYTINGTPNYAAFDEKQRGMIFVATAPAVTTYTVTYDANGGTGTMVGNMVEENGKLTLGNCTYIAPEGYQFKAWAIGSVNGEQKQPGEQITITAETYIYAIWEAVQAIPNGWRLESGKWYFYENGAKVKSAWRKDSNGWCYLGSDGAMVTNQWVQDSIGWCFVDGNGYCITNAWKRDSYGWCYLGSEGSQVKNNWVLDDGKWYFIDADGYMVSNQWRKDSKGWCWLTASGAMATNQWVKDSKGWCYVGADGYCWTNRWAKDSIGWIWLDSEGSMTKSKWILDGGKWYYLNANGYMVANTTITISGKRYTFNASGVWVG